MEIRNLKMINKGMLIASFDVYFPVKTVFKQYGMAIRDFKFFRGEKGEWISFPSREYTDETGKRKFYDYLVFDPYQGKEGFSNLLKQMIVPLLPKNKNENENSQECPF